MTTEPRNTLDLLRRFNAKERFHLLMYALGQPSPTEGEYPTFQLGTAFREKLGTLLDGITIPGDAFCAMDFHFDWIHAAVHVGNGMVPNSNDPGRTFANAEDAVRGNQQDVDFLVAFEGPGKDGKKKLHLIMFEAKYASGWNSTQLSEKIERLTATFGEENKHGRTHDIQPYYILISRGPAPPPPPKPNSKQKKQRPPKLMKAGVFPWWLAGLDADPDPEKVRPIQMWLKYFDLLKVTRCDAEGTPNKVGGNWKIMDR